MYTVKANEWLEATTADDPYQNLLIALPDLTEMMPITSGVTGGQ